MEKDVITLEVNIFRYDKEANAGKLRVVEGQVIPQGEYTFKVIKQSSPRQYILAMTKPIVIVNALKEIEKHASGVTRISRLHIVSIQAIKQGGQGELF